MHGHTALNYNYEGISLTTNSRTGTASGSIRLRQGAGVGELSLAQAA